MDIIVMDGAASMYTAGFGPLSSAIALRMAIEWHGVIMTDHETQFLRDWKNREHVIRTASRDVPPPVCIGTGNNVYSLPFFKLLDTANGNVSVMEEYAASMEFMDSSGSNGYGINYFSYSTNINVVPVDMQFPGGAQDLVNATWVPNDIYNSYYTYTGPSYSASLSLPFYLVQMQD